MREHERGGRNREPQRPSPAGTLEYEQNRQWKEAEYHAGVIQVPTGRHGAEGVRPLTQVVTQILEPPSHRDTRVGAPQIDQHECQDDCDRSREYGGAIQFQRSTPRGYGRHDQKRDDRRHELNTKKKCRARNGTGGGGARSPGALEPSEGKRKGPYERRGSGYIDERLAPWNREDRMQGKDEAGAPRCKSSVGSRAT